MIELPTWMIGPLFVFTGPLAIVFVLGFAFGFLTARR